MSATIDTNDVIKCTFVVQGLDGQVALPSVYYLGGLVSGLGGSIAQLLSVLDTIATADLLPVISNTAAYKGVMGQRIFPLPITFRETDTSGAANGTGGAGAAPLQAAPVITWETPLAGPSQRGRFYSPFMPDGKINTTTGELTALYKASLQTLANSLTGVASAGSGADQTVLFQAIWHRGPKTTDIITAGIAQPRVGTQKRRGNYGKKNLSPI